MADTFLLATCVRLHEPLVQPSLGDGDEPRHTQTPTLCLSSLFRQQGE